MFCSHLTLIKGIEKTVRINLPHGFSSNTFPVCKVIFTSCYDVNTYADFQLVVKENLYIPEIRHYHFYGTSTEDTWLVYFVYLSNHVIEMTPSSLRPSFCNPCVTAFRPPRRREVGQRGHQYPELQGEGRQVGWHNTDSSPASRTKAFKPEPFTDWWNVRVCCFL